MENNLEGLDFKEVFNDKGISYASFRSGLKPDYARVIYDIFKGYGWLMVISAAIVILVHRFPEWWWVVIIPGAIFIGYNAAYLALFIHEAGHFNVYPDKKINDRFATIFLGIPFGLSLKSYRKIHWQHHLHLGTPEDAEVSYFNHLTKLFLLETLTGVHLLKTIRKKENSNLLTPAQQKDSRQMILSGAVFHIFILGVSILTRNWQFAIAWAAGFGIFFPFFATIRQILEHRDELAKPGTDFYKQPHGKLSRLFVHNFLSSSFGSAGFTRHMIHHWDPQISYTRLKDIEDFLASSPQTAAIIKNSRTHYRTALKKLLRAS
jgi:fatty acid desaturase